MSRIISQDDAVEIALTIALRDREISEFPSWLATIHTVTDSPDRYPGIYGGPIAEPAWFVLVPWFDGHDGNSLRSSRLIVLAKIDGHVLYDGSAHDEG